MRFDFATATRIIFGSGTLREISSIAPELGRRVWIVTGSHSAGYDLLHGLLCEQGLVCETFQMAGEPEIGQVSLGLEAARSFAADLVIAIGGGSVLDTGKAIAGLLPNPGDLLDYLEVVGRNQALPGPGVPFVAIPTTAGTGSEVTRNAVLAVPEHRVKVSLRSPYLLARVAIVDPELTLSVPPALTASTGMDALTQVIEPYVSRRANAMTDLFCREGMDRAARSLGAAFNNGGDHVAREDMAWTSLLGGLALANAGLGAVHGFAAPIGGMFSAPHGAVCACLLPVVTDINVRAIFERRPDDPILQRYLEMARILTQEPGAAVAAGIRWLEELKSGLAIPALSSYGIGMKDVDLIVAKAAQASSMKANPVDLTATELREILERSL